MSVFQIRPPLSNWRRFKFADWLARPKWDRNQFASLLLRLNPTSFDEDAKIIGNSPALYLVITRHVPIDGHFFAQIKKVMIVPELCKFDLLSDRAVA